MRVDLRLVQYPTGSTRAPRGSATFEKANGTSERCVIGGGRVRIPIIAFEKRLGEHEVVPGDRRVKHFELLGLEPHEP